MMKNITLLIIFSFLLIPPGRSIDYNDQDIDQGYALLNEAYQARGEGNQELAREKLSRALDIFRNTAATQNLIGNFGPETEIIPEKTDQGINLIENKVLFKIEINAGIESSPDRGSLSQEQALQQQQLILQKLIYISRENDKVKKILSGIMKDSKEIDDIAGTVSNIEDNTENLDDIEDQVDTIEDNTDDIADDTDDIQSDTDDIASDVSDIANELDVLHDILQVVEDIKNDTDRISDVHDAVEEVKDAVENQSQSQ